MEVSEQTTALGWIGLTIASIGMAWTLYVQFAGADSVLWGLLGRYETWLARDVDFLRLAFKPRQIAVAQAVASAGCLAASVLVWSPAPIFAIPLIIGVPLGLIQRARDKRVLELEDQMGAWMVGLANTLRATPALGVALDYSSRLVGTPLSEELDLMLKERDLGTPVDHALRKMGDRIDSRTVRSVLAALIIGRSTGGKLPDILEVSAGQLREMQRLEGVIRTKTAEGRGQAWVLALMPFGLLFGIHLVDHDFFLPLTYSYVGYLVMAIGLGLWLGAILVARKILQLDI